MSTHNVTIVNGSLDGMAGLRELTTTFIRAPVSIVWADPVVVYTFTPDLTAQELVLFGQLQDVLRSPIALTKTEYDAIRPNIQALRDFRQLGRNAFIALVQNERDRQLYDRTVDITIILLALLRTS